MKVNFFVTCLGDTVKAEVAKKTVGLLEQLGCEVIFPERQGCCGQPALNSGYIEKSKPAMKNMIEAFEINDFPIVTPAGSCAAAVKKYPEYLADEPEWADRAKKVADRLFELTQFVVRQLGVENVGARLEGKGVYHPSCSLIRKLGVREEPLILLNNVEGLELLPIENQETCCGFGGTFSVKMGNISEQMVDEKVDCAVQTGAEYLVASDGGCIMNISGRMNRRGEKISTMHIAEILTQHEEVH